jgi:hypothetical protein
MLILLCIWSLLVHIVHHCSTVVNTSFKFFLFYFVGFCDTFKPMSKDSEIKVRLPQVIKDRLKEEGDMMETNASHIVRLAINQYFQSRDTALKS